MRTPLPWSWLSPIILASLACSSSPEKPDGRISSGGTASSVGGSSSGPNAGSGNSPTTNGGSGDGLGIDAGVGVGGGGGTPDVMNGECAHEAFELARQPAEILLVLDRSGSMKETPSGSTMTKWDVVVPGINEVVTTTDAAVSWGLKVFPEGEGQMCVAGSVTAAIPVAIAKANAAAVTAEVTATTPAGNGTPTGAAINAAVTYLKTLTEPNPKIILLATDGEPTCAATGSNTAAARTFAVQAITDAATAGFKTVVVGVATTKTATTQALNDMAVAGQMARVDPDPTGTKFYLASTKDELVAALQKITGEVSNCVFDLKTTPPDPDNIAVQINGQKAPKDTTHMNGWDYTGTGYLRVEVFGQWCDQLKAADAKKVNFVLGCPGEVIP